MAANGCSVRATVAAMTYPCEQCNHERSKHGARGCDIGGCDCGRRYATGARKRGTDEEDHCHGQDPARLTVDEALALVGGT